MAATPLQLSDFIVIIENCQVLGPVALVDPTCRHNICYYCQIHFSYANALFTELIFFSRDIPFDRHPNTPRHAK